MSMGNDTLETNVILVSLFLEKSYIGMPKRQIVRQSRV